jgi:hypothetical protein
MRLICLTNVRRILAWLSDTSNCIVM